MVFSETVWLSTAPTEPLTHWYQVRCLFDKPLMAYAGQIVKGKIKLVANERCVFCLLFMSSIHFFRETSVFSNIDDNASISFKSLVIFRQSYDVEISAEVNGQTANNSLDLKNPLFRYTGAAVVPPPGNAVESPADALLQRIFFAA